MNYTLLSPEDKSRNRMLRILRVVFTVALLYVILKQVGLSNVISTLHGADLGQMLLAALFFLLGTIVRSFRWWSLLHSSGYELSLGYVLGLSFTGEFFSTALPTGYAGDAVRVLELRVGESRMTSLGFVILDRILGLLVLMVVGLIALMIGHAWLPKTTTLILGILSLVGLLGTIAIIHGVFLKRLIASAGRALAFLPEGWLDPLSQAIEMCPRSAIRTATALSLLNALFTVGNHYMVALAVGINLGIGVFFIFTPIVNLSLLMPTISGLGLREAGYQILLTPYGIPSEVAVALGLGIYFTRLLTALMGGAYDLLKSARR